MKTIKIPENYLEYLLACLASQKFIHELNTDDLKSVQAENQRAIDNAYSKGWEFLGAHGLRTLKWNGEHWYVDKRSLWKRCRQWVIWIGGWERPNGTGWKFRNPYDRSIFMPPFPVSIFGHHFTWFGWGWQLKLRHWHMYLTWSKTSGCYVSANGTPPDNGRTKGFFIYQKKHTSALLKRLRREEKA